MQAHSELTELQKEGKYITVTSDFKSSLNNH